MQTPLPNPLGLTADQFVAAFRGIVPGGHVAAQQRYARLFREGDRTGLEAQVDVGAINRIHTSESGEGTVLKFTQWVAGRKPEEQLETESVLIPMIGKKRERSYTLCVSSQVGCAMGCGFCQTAQMGLIRSLHPWEIIQQWFAASELLRQRRAAPHPPAPSGRVDEALRVGEGTLLPSVTADQLAGLDPEADIRNIVFMGMGEPMDNLDAVLQAIDVLTDQRGPAIAPSRITVSTVGRVDGIARFAQYVARPGMSRVALAISLNAPSDEVRSTIMPINRAMPMAKLREPLVAWPATANSHLCLEYVLIPGVNDAPEHADQLAAYVRGDDFGLWENAPAFDPATKRWPGPALHGLVNIIPYNPREGSPWPAPSEESVDAFVARLTAHGVYTKRRRTKGRDQMAACGQLGNLAYRRKPVTVSVTR